MEKYKLDSWVLELLADPLTKKQAGKADFKKRGKDNLLDARIFLKNTPGFKIWEEGQIEYEQWEQGSNFYKNQVENYKKEIKYDSPVYEKFPISGKVLDVGGGAGMLREFMVDGSKLVSVDPFLDPVGAAPESRKEAYSCFKEPLNFIIANAEFIPFIDNSFDIVHMRSMLDHVQGPDLTIMEARRVLKKDGFLLIGMTVEGGENGKLSFEDNLKEFIRLVLTFLGFKKYKDHHIMHPTFPSLVKILEDNDFKIEEVYWQPYWKGKVVYIKAIQKRNL